MLMFLVFTPVQRRPGESSGIAVVQRTGYWGSPTWTQLIYWYWYWLILILIDIDIDIVITLKLLPCRVLRVPNQHFCILPLQLYFASPFSFSWEERRLLWSSCSMKLYALPIQLLRTFSPPETISLISILRILWGGVVPIQLLRTFAPEVTAKFIVKLSLQLQLAE